MGEADRAISNLFRSSYLTELRVQPVLRRPALMPLMVAVMARLRSGESSPERLRRRSSTWSNDKGST